jgi:ADP-heptose:LPS heptosyltransferase
LAHISVRIGTGYRWYSFLFNYKHFEHRKYSVRHEAEYNLSLLKPLELSPNVPIISELEITDEEQEKASEMKKQMGIQNGDTFIILHPGSGGSARDWKPVRFAELAKKFLRTGCKVVITGSKDERTLIDFVAEKAGEGILSLKEDLNLKQLGAFIKKADLFISNSTGPLHIAAAVGVPVIGFYPPIQSCSPTRWGPLTEKKIIFQPDVNQCPRCKGGPCQGDDCMELITVSSVFEASKIFLNRYKGD